MLKMVTPAVHAIHRCAVIGFLGPQVTVAVPTAHRFAVALDLSMVVQGGVTTVSGLAEVPL
jgi:hypothetical protein